MTAPPRTATGLVVALAVYAVLRALILISQFDEVAMPQFELFPMGTIPLLVGVDGGLPFVRVYDNAAGQLLTGLLAVPAYALFGPSYLALKLVPVALGGATIVLLWSSLRTLAGPRAGDVAALLFAAGPTTLTKYSMMASGNHFETLCFTTLALWCWARVHSSGASAARLAAFGAACGFALFVFLGALTPIGLLLVAHIGVRGVRNAARDALWIAPGFALGFAPLVALNLATGGRALAFLDQKFGDGGAARDTAGVLERLGDFVLERLPEAAQHHDLGLLPGALGNALFLAAFVGAYALLAGGAWRSSLRALRSLLSGAAHEPLELSGVLSAILCAYLPLTALAYSLSTLEIEPKAPPMDAEGFRYFNTHFLFAAALIGVAAERWRTRSAWLARAPFVAALAAGVFNLALVDWSFRAPNAGAYFDGFRLRQVATQMTSPRNGYTGEQVVAMIESYPRSYRPWLYQGVGRVEAARRFLAARDGEIALWEALDGYPPERRGDVARGFGTFFRHIGRVRSRLDERFVRMAREALAAGAPHAARAVEGLATDWEIAMPRDFERDFAEMEALLASLPGELRSDYARGYGAVCGRKLARGLPYDVELTLAAIERVPPELRASFFEGVGAGRVESVRGSNADALERFTPVERAAIERGGALRRAELGL